MGCPQKQDDAHRCLPALPVLRYDGRLLCGQHVEEHGPDLALHGQWQPACTAQHQARSALQRLSEALVSVRSGSNNVNWAHPRKNPSPPGQPVAAPPPPCATCRASAITSATPTPPGVGCQACMDAGHLSRPLSNAAEAAGLVARAPPPPPLLVPPPLLHGQPSSSSSLTASPRASPTG